MFVIPYLRATTASARSLSIPAREIARTQAETSVANATAHGHLEPSVAPARDIKSIENGWLILVAGTVCSLGGT